MKKPKVSIIVPVYKVEDYLSNCVESILAQTFTDWELLLIDDGSPDGSGILCDVYSSEDPRIRVFHKENGGVSSARNLGLDNVRGEWVSFVDADDAIEPETLLECSALFEEADIIRYPMRFIYSKDGSQMIEMVLPQMSKEQYLSKIASRETIMGVCGGLYSANLFNNKKFRFNDSLVSGEDWVMLTRLVMLADEVKIIDKPFYLYTKYNELSATYVPQFRTLLSSSLAQKEVEEVFIEYKLNDYYRRPLAKGKCDLIYNFLALIFRNTTCFSKKQVESFFNEVDLSVKEIHLANPQLIKKLVLYLYTCKYGRNLFKSRLQ